MVWDHKTSLSLPNCNWNACTYKISQRACICVIVESLWPVSGHVFLSASGIVVACDRSCICVIVESLWPLIGHVFV